MTETLMLALTADSEPAWYGYATGVAHALLTFVENPGGDHLGGSGVKALTVHNTTLETARLEERFQGDRRCKSCERAVEAAMLHRLALIAQANTDAFIAESDARLAETVTQSEPAPSEPESAPTLLPAATVAVMLPSLTETLTRAQSTPRKPRGRKAQEAAEWSATLDSVIRPDVTPDETETGEEEEPPSLVKVPGVQQREFPPAPGGTFGTGVLDNEAAFVQGSAMSGAPADRRKIKNPVTGAREVASRGTMASKNAPYAHVDLTVKRTDADMRVDPDVNVTRAEYAAMSKSARRRTQGKITQAKRKRSGLPMPRTFRS